MIKIVISENDAGQRLDRFLRKYFKRASLSAIYKMIRKDVKLNGKRTREDTILTAGDCLSCYISEEKLQAMTADQKRRTARRQFKIAYEDPHLLIVNKPAGLLTHGDAHEKKNTLVNQVCGYLQEKGEFVPSKERTFSPAPVNRLDRNTTGLVIFGKDAQTLRSFTALLRERNRIEKYYLTILCGCLETSLFLDDRLTKDGSKNMVQAAEGSRGKEAATYVKPLLTGKAFTLAEVQIFTGRTHQIRVHLADAGYPLAGDTKYGSRRINEALKKKGVTTQLLHAYKLRFAEMPEEFAALRGKVIEAPLPPEFLRIKKLLVPQQESCRKGY